MEKKGKDPIKLHRIEAMLFSEKVYVELLRKCIFFCPVKQLTYTMRPKKHRIYCLIFLHKEEKA